MRLIEVRLLDGPNLYRLEPTVKVEVAIGRRRSWYGQRSPERHSVVRLNARVARDDAPPTAVRLADWVRRLHRVVLDERGARVTLHRTSEPGHWIVAFPWRERGRAETLGHAALRLTERGADPRRSDVPAGAVRRILEADTEPPEWITDTERQMPTIGITGTNGKSTTTRMIGHIMRTCGRRVGMTTSDGVLVDGVMVEEGDLTGPQGARSVLQHPDVDVAVLETARGGILLRGLGYQSNDASVITNVSADHLDLQGVHTLPELAEVKSIVAEVTRPGGMVVLNADDPLVAALARRVRAPVCLFSLAIDSAPVRRHVARGGRALVFDGEWLLELAGARRTRIVRAADVPATLDGLARHNVANALAAAAGARALGATRAQVAAGLRDFRPSADQMPGRLNLYRCGQRLVIVDFAHNEAGVAALLDVAEGLVGPRGRRRRGATVSAIIGTAGDRPDDTLRAIGRIAAERADEVCVKETLRYLRGRTRESAVAELTAGVREGGGVLAGMPIHESEPIALRAELTDDRRLAGADDGPPRVVLLMCHSHREEVEALLTELGAEAVTDVGAVRATLGL